MDGDLGQALAAVGATTPRLAPGGDTTLAELSAVSGMSVRTLSRLESGQRRATLELLLPLVRAYRVALDELVGAPPTGDPRIHAHPITCNGMTIVPLIRRAGGIQAFRHVIPAGRAHQEPKVATHDGYEGCTSSAGGSDSCSASTTWCCHPAKPPSLTPGYRTGSVAAGPNRWSSSACSGRKANASTSAPAPGDPSAERAGRAAGVLAAGMIGR